MAAILTVTTLRSNRDEITASIPIREKRLARVRAVLAHIDAAISIFEASGDPKGCPACVNVHRLFDRGEPMALCKRALGRRPSDHPLACRLRHEGQRPRPGDLVLAKSAELRLIHAPRMQTSGGLVRRIGKNKAALIWVLPPQMSLV